MAYLFFQMWLWLLIAFLLGLVIGGIVFCYLCRCKRDHEQTSGISEGLAAAPMASSPKVEASAPVDTGVKPNFLAERPDRVDNLKRIKGVGPVLEKTLNKLGVYQFSQIAAFSSDNVKWVNNYLAFPGRIERENWVDQAKDLDAGTETEFSKRVDKGELDY